MKDSDRYAKIVEWSDEDQCYIGRAPGLMFGGCHGDDAQKVFAELCDIVDEVVASIIKHGEALPPPTTGENLVKALKDLQAA
jgi:predicted RNase H-like HicB family nuclease